MSARPAPRAVLWLAAGFGIWSSAFVSLYSLQGLGCGLGWPAGVLRTVLALVLLAHLGLLALLVLRFLRARRRGWRKQGAFLGPVALWAAWAGLVAMVGTLAPGLVLTACA
jgi:hypothetical protein